MREHPIFGGIRFHSGIDMDVPDGSDLNVRTIAGGRVLHTGWLSGWGNSVVVMTPDGYIEQYNHLDFFGVSPGEIIQPGTSVGKLGNTGNSTGPHLDFVVWNNTVGEDGWGYNPQQNTINPRDYMAMTHTLQEAPRNTGVVSSPVSYSPIPEDANLEQIVATFRSNWDRHTQQGVLTGGVGGTARYVEPSSQAYNYSSPERPSRASIFRSSYIQRGNVQVHNDPANNYGYDALARNRDYRIALARTASQLNIPAMWLADVIDYETGGTHSAMIDNGYSPAGSGVPCTGLIQFCDTGGLVDLAQWWGMSVEGASRRLKRMTHATQLEWVGKWIARYSNDGRDLGTIEDLYALINGGPGALAANPARRAENYADINGGLPHHFSELGARAGRRYQTTYDRLNGGTGSIHYRITQGCTECQRHMNLWGKVEPHYPP